MLPNVEVVTENMFDIKNKRKTAVTMPITKAKIPSFQL